MQVKVRQEGNDLLLVISRDLFTDIPITSDTQFDVASDGRALVISPTEEVDEIGDDEFDAILEKINLRYSRVFQRLAE